MPDGPAERSARGSAARAALRAHEEDRRQHRVFTELWERHYDLVRRYLLQRCPPDATEDLLQEAFLRIWESRNRPLDEARMPAYLMTVTRNLWIDHLRWQRNWGNVVPLEEVVLAEDPERQLAANLRYDTVRQAVRRLSPRRRAVFELRWLAGFSHREIAERLQITVKTVENHLNAAYRELRDLFQELDANGTGSVAANGTGRGAADGPGPLPEGAP